MVEHEAPERPAWQAKREADKAALSADVLVEGACPVCAAPVLLARDSRSTPSRLATDWRLVGLEPAEVTSPGEENRLLSLGCRTYQTYGRTTVRVFGRTSIERRRSRAGDPGVRVLREHWCMSVEARRRAEDASRARMPAEGPVSAL